jgi:type II secretory pathway component PulF
MTLPPPSFPTRLIAIPEPLIPQVERLLARQNAPRPITDWPLTLCLAAIAAVLTWSLLYWVPRFEDIFRDFGTRLPTPTVILLIASRYFGHQSGWIIAWAIALGLPVFVARLRPWPPRHPTAWWLAYASISALTIIAIIAITIIVLCLPMLTLIETVSSKPAR